MPKSIVVDPREARKPGTLSFSEVPLNAYVPDMKKELKAFGKEALLRAYRDMVIIREFETMLNLIKTKGAYQGISYDHLGPAHHVEERVPDVLPQVARVDELPEDPEEDRDVRGMETRGGLVEDEEDVAFRRTARQEGRDLQTLGLAARERRRRLP